MLDEAGAVGSAAEGWLGRSIRRRDDLTMDQALCHRCCVHSTAASCVLPGKLYGTITLD